MVKVVNEAVVDLVRDHDQVKLFGDPSDLHHPNRLTPRIVLELRDLLTDGIHYRSKSIPLSRNCFQVWCLPDL